MLIIAEKYSEIKNWRKFFNIEITEKSDVGYHGAEMKEGRVVRKRTHEYRPPILKPFFISNSFPLFVFLPFHS